MTELEALRTELARLEAAYLSYTAGWSQAKAEAGADPPEEVIQWIEQNRTQCETLQQRIAQLTLQEPRTTTAPMAQGKTMAEPQDTRQEKETRWEAQRAAHNQAQQARQGARHRTTAQHWVFVAALIFIVAVMAAVVLR